MPLHGSAKGPQEAILYFTDFEKCKNFLIPLRWLDGKMKCPRCPRTFSGLRREGTNGFDSFKSAASQTADEHLAWNGIAGKNQEPVDAPP